MELDARSQELELVLSRRSRSIESDKVGRHAGFVKHAMTFLPGHPVNMVNGMCPVYTVQVQCMELQQQLQAKQEDLAWLQSKCQSHHQLVDAIEGTSL